jgi:hypothetical protein
VLMTVRRGSTLEAFMEVVCLRRHSYCHAFL